MHLQTVEQVKKNIGPTSVFYHVHSLGKSCSIQAWVVTGVYEDDIGMWAKAEPACVTPTATDLKIRRADQTWVEDYHQFRLTSKYNDHFSLADAGVTDKPYNRHKLFTTLSEAKLYCETELGIRGEREPDTEAFTGLKEIIAAPAEALEKILDDLTSVQPMNVDLGAIREALPSGWPADEEGLPHVDGLAAVHDSGNNGLQTNPELIFEETVERVTPPEGKVDATVPNLMVVS